MFLLNLENTTDKLKKNLYQFDIKKIDLVLSKLKKNTNLKKKINLMYLKIYFFVLHINNVKKNKFINNIFLKMYSLRLISHIQKQLFLNKIYNYLFKINFLKSNIVINVTDIKGKPFLKTSSGLMHFKSKQKTKVLAFNSVFRKIKFEIRKKSHLNFSIHVKGKGKKKKIFNLLKNYLELKAFSSFNLIPFNGCRQKKKKRKKKKKLLYII
jgi:ribosomal protein S11